MIRCLQPSAIEFERPVPIDPQTRPDSARLVDRSPVEARSVRKVRIDSSVRCMLGLLVLLLSALDAAADDHRQVAAALPLFESDATLAVTLRAPWRRIARDTDKQAAYPATLEYADVDGLVRKIELTVERRGLTRQRVCRFPPIRLRFKRDDVVDTVFAGNKSIKMVTHCDPARRWDQYYILEYLAYRIYNLVTDYSFRVRPLTVSYRESQGDNTDQPRFAFLIEDDKQVVERNGVKKSDAVSIQPRQLDSLQSSRFSLFQYLIANVDWSVLSGPKDDQCCHNARLLLAASGQQLLPLPYDFDSSGLVDAHYAAPNESLPIHKVTQRLFRGFCLHNDTLEAARAEFIALRPAIEDVINAEAGLRERSRTRTLTYLQEFFAVLGDDRKFQREIIADCRK